MERLSRSDLERRDRDTPVSKWGDCLVLKPGEARQMIELYLKRPHPLAVQYIASSTPAAGTLTFKVSIGFEMGAFEFGSARLPFAADVQSIVVAAALDGATAPTSIKVAVWATPLDMPAIASPYRMLNSTSDAESEKHSNVAQAAVDTAILAADNPDPFPRRDIHVFNDSLSDLLLRYGTGAASATDFTLSIPPGEGKVLPRIGNAAWQGAIRGIWRAAGAGAARITVFK